MGHAAIGRRGDAVRGPYGSCDAWSWGRRRATPVTMPRRLVVGATPCVARMDHTTVRRRGDAVRRPYGSRDDWSSPVWITRRFVPARRRGSLRRRFQELQVLAGFHPVAQRPFILEQQDRGT